MDNMEIVKNEVKNIMDDLETIKNFERKITETLKPLKKWTEEINIFSILKIDTYEIRHSNMLAWLIDPNGNHGLKDKFLKKLLDKSFNISTDNKDWTDTIVYREKENIDILAVSDKNRLVCAIENKIFSDEHDNQLERYREWLEETYKGFTFILYYLTPYGIKPTDENWQTLDYEFILESLEDCLKNPKLNEKTTIYIKDYINAVRRSVVMNDKDLKDCCEKIYNKNKEELDLIFKYKPDRYAYVGKVCDEFLKENFGKYGIDSESYTKKSQIEFTTEKLKKACSSYKKDDWFIGFQLYYAPNSNLSMSLYILPGGSAEVRNTIIRKAKEKKYIGKECNVGPGYKQLKKYFLLSKEVIENTADFENLKKDIEYSIQKCLDENLEKINNDFS